MDEQKPIITTIIPENQKEENNQIQPSSTKIIIENDTSEFEKPEDPKSPSQIPNETDSPPQNILSQNQPLSKETPNISNITPPENNINNVNTNTNNNNNISNTNLTLVTNTDQGYLASLSNEISSYTPPKSKTLNKKTVREYICEEENCKKIFYDKSSLRKHILTHGEKLFICNICKKKFLDNSKLRRHSLVHSGEKPYACPLCPKRFSLDFNLRTHMRIHSGEKPYACVYPGCFKRFSQSSNLSAHEKTHEILKKEGGDDVNKPIFIENPLKLILDNPFSGKETLDNIKKINELYELMQKGIILQMNMINLGNGQVTKNHGEIPGMPIQKRTYIKRANKENNNISSNSNIKNNNASYYNSDYIGNENNGYFSNNISEDSKNNRRLIFQVNEGENSNSEINKLYLDANNDSNKNQFLQPYTPSLKKKIFATHRDQETSEKKNINISLGNKISSDKKINNFENNNDVNYGTLIDLSGKKKKNEHKIDLSGYAHNSEFEYDNEDNIENKVINLIEEEDKNNLEDISDNSEKDEKNENFYNF